MVIVHSGQQVRREVLEAYEVRLVPETALYKRFSQEVFLSLFCDKSFSASSLIVLMWWFTYIATNIIHTKRQIVIPSAAVLYTTFQSK